MNLVLKWKYRSDWLRLWWWKDLFFEKGQGWLRWGLEERQEPHDYYDMEPGEHYTVAPPLRRLWYWVWGQTGQRIEMMLVRDEETGKRVYEWSETGMTWADLKHLKDKDRLR